MVRVNVNASTKYEVLIGSGIIGSLGRELLKIKPSCKVMLVTDDNVAPLYLDETVLILKNAGYEVNTFTVKNGEGAKSKDVLFELLNELVEKSFKRSDMLVALGGGVVGDLTGFAASVYMRGVDFVQLPTTLLAAVDSSVGGKTAVNLDGGKNLAGTFWQPKMVLCDTARFKTLPKEVFAAGCAEVIKYGAVLDKEFFEMLENGALENNIEGVVQRCVEIKRDIVEADEFDKGKRAVLNFGHTIGHAIEKASNYKLAHGLAVGIGMVMISKAAQKAGMCKGITERLIPLLEKHGIPTECGYSSAELVKGALSDKKSDKDGITVILPAKIGEYTLYKATSYELIKLIELGVN